MRNISSDHCILGPTPGDHPAGISVKDREVQLVGDDDVVRRDGLTDMFCFYFIQCICLFYFILCIWLFKLLVYFKS